MNYKEVLEKVLFDDSYRKILKVLVSQSALSIDEAIHWYKLGRIACDSSSLDLDMYLKTVVELSNRGYSRDAIARSVLPPLNSAAEESFNKTK